MKKFIRKLFVDIDISYRYETMLQTNKQTNKQTNNQTQVLYTFTEGGVLII